MIPDAPYIDARSILYRCQIDAGSILDRCWIDPGSIMDRSRIDLGSLQHRSGIDPASIRHRSGIDTGSISHRYREHQGSSGTLSGLSGMPKAIKKHQKSKNHQFQFLRLRFEALDELDRLVIVPKVKNKQNSIKFIANDTDF